MTVQSEVLQLFSAIDFLTYSEITTNQGGLSPTLLSELNGYVAAVTANTETLAQVQAAIEQDAYTQTYVDPVIRMYQAAYGRVPDQAGEAYWVGKFATQPGAIGEMATIFANSGNAVYSGTPGEFQLLYGGATANTPSGTSGLGAILVTDLYENVLGRTPDPQGLLFWEQSGLDAAQLLQAFATSAEFINDSAPAIINYQNLEAKGTPPAPNGPPPLVSLLSLAPTQTLTLNQDNVVATGNGVQIVSGVVGVAATQTFQDFDSITGNGRTIVDLTVTGSGYAPGVAPINNVASVNIQAAYSNTFSAAYWTNIGVIGVTSTPVNSANNTTTTIISAPISSTYELNTPGVTASLDIGFGLQQGQTPTGNFIIAGSGASATNMATLDATSVPGYSNELTAAVIATSNTNFDTINLGTADALVTLLGTGMDDFSFGALKSTVEIDFRQETNNQILWFVSGQLDHNNTVLGGAGANDIVVSNGTAVADGLTMSGVENYVTSFLTGGSFNGANVTGLLTLTANQPGTTVVPITLTHMGGEFDALNINGIAGAASVTYTHEAGSTTVPTPINFVPAPELTVTYGETGVTAPTGPYLTNFAGLTVTGLSELTVNFDNGASFSNTGPTTIGAVTIDNTFTTDLTLNAGGGLIDNSPPSTPTPSPYAPPAPGGANVTATVYITSYAALQNLTVESIGDNASYTTMDLVAGPNQSPFEELAPLGPQGSTGINDVTVAAGVNQTGGTVGGTTLANFTPTGAPGSSTAVTESFAFIDNSKGSDDAVAILEGGINNVTVVSGGVVSEAEILGGTEGNGVSASGMINHVNVAAWNFDSVAVIASGSELGAGVVSGSTTWPIGQGPGGIGDVTVNAAGPVSFAEIAGIFAGVATSGNIGNVGTVSTLNHPGQSPTGIVVETAATGFTAHAAIVGFEYGVAAQGTIGLVEVQANGVNSTADIDPSVNEGIGVFAANNFDQKFLSGQVVGIETVLVQANASGASAYIYGGHSGVVTYGEIGALTVNASAEASFAGITGDDGNGVEAVKNIGTLLVSTGGGPDQAINAQAEIYGAENGVLVYIGGIGNLTVLAAASGSSAEIHGNDGAGVLLENVETLFPPTATGGGDIGVLAVVAGESSASNTGYYLPARNSEARIHGSEVGVEITDGDIGKLIVTAGSLGSDAHIFGGFASHGTGVAVEGTISSITLTASGNGNFSDVGHGHDQHDVSGGLAYIDGGDMALDVSGIINRITLTASGASSSASIGHYGGHEDGFTFGESQVGGIGALTVTASGYYSVAELYHTIVDGSIGAVKVSATGVSSFARVHLDGFDSNAPNGPVTLIANNAHSTVDFNYGGENALSTITVTSTLASDTVNLYLDQASDNYSGAITETAGAGTLNVHVYGQSFVTLDAHLATGDLNIYVLDTGTDPSNATGQMFITTPGAGSSNFIEVGNGSTLNGTSGPGTVANYITLTAGSANVLDFSNLLDQFNGVHSTQPTEVVTGFVGVAEGGGDSIAFGMSNGGSDEPENGLGIVSTANYDGSNATNFLALTSESSVANLINDSIVYFATHNGHPDFTYGVVGNNGYVVFNGYETGGAHNGTNLVNNYAAEIVELVGTSAGAPVFTAGDLIHNDTGYFV